MKTQNFHLIGTDRKTLPAYIAATPGPDGTTLLDLQYQTAAGEGCSWDVSYRLRFDQSGGVATDSLSLTPVHPEPLGGVTLS